MRNGMRSRNNIKKATLKALAIGAIAEAATAEFISGAFASGDKIDIPSRTRMA